MTYFWSFDRQDVAIVLWCDRCGGEIYAPEASMEIGGRLLCLDCLRELLERLRAQERADERGRRA